MCSHASRKNAFSESSQLRSFMRSCFTRISICTFCRAMSSLDRPTIQPAYPVTALPPLLPLPCSRSPLETSARAPNPRNPKADHSRCPAGTVPPLLFFARARTTPAPSRSSDHSRSALAPSNAYSLCHQTPAVPRCYQPVLRGQSDFGFRNTFQKEGGGRVTIPRQGRQGSAWLVCNGRDQRISQHVAMPSAGLSFCFNLSHDRLGFPLLTQTS